MYHYTNVGAGLFLYQVLLQHSDAKLLVDETDLYENTPLHIASTKGYALIATVGDFYFNFSLILFFYF